MSSLKTIKRKAQAPGPYRQALIELGVLRDRLDVLKVGSGDTVLFRLGDHSTVTTSMIEAFMQVAQERGILDLNCFLLKQGDSIDRISESAFAELAALKGYVKQPEEVSEDGGSVLPTGYEELASLSDPEGEDGRQETAEGIRLEDPEGERFLSDEEVRSLLGRLSQTFSKWGENDGIRTIQARVQPGERYEEQSADSKAGQ